jgi:ATP-dependent protease ClpP protease subunit
MFDRSPRVFSHDYGTVTDFYLCSAIGDPSEYIEWFQRIRSARDSDILRFHINSPGGNLLTAIQLMHALSETEAVVVMSVEGACMSAATLLFLMGDEYQITEHSIFLFHNYAGGTIGKGGEMYHGIVHERKWTENLLRSSYKDFLTDDEISHLIDDKDVWMDSESILLRLQERAKKQEAAAEESEAEVQPVKKKRGSKAN